MRNDFLKLIAIVLMVIDHTASAFSDSLNPTLYHTLRAIGRLCFPIFAYHIALGFEKTSNLKRYAFRLFLFAVIAQPIYWLLWPELNIMFTLLLGLGALYLNEKNPLFLIPYSILVYGIDYFLTIDYGILGVFMILFFRISPFIGNAMIILLKSLSVWYNSLALLGVFLTRWNPPWRIRLPRYFFYVFYPLHLLIIWIIR
ncbi:MAG: TraX family protein [Candidatus Woesearchaeota archaeon]